MRRITISDLCEITGYSRNQMRGLLAELPRFACRHAEPRVARAYSNHDVMLVVLLCRLEMMYGLKRSIVSALCEPVAAALAVPRKVSKQACLVVRIHDVACDYVDAAPRIDDGLVVALGPIFMAIDSYLLPTPLIQREVGLSATGTFYKPTSTASAGGRQKRSEQDCVPHARQRGRPNHG